MSLSFKPRRYTCLECSYEGKIIAAFSSLQNISDYFPRERILDPIVDIEDNSILYEQVLERDDFGLVTKREAVKCKCESCGTTNIRAIKVDNCSNVLNFYPAANAGQWLEGFSSKLN